jgi:hypothetical protein
MLRRTFLPALLLFLALATVSGALYAQLESGERGILPIDSSGTLEITGIHVDVGGPDAASARFAGWRLAQRQGFRALWAKTHGRPISEAPSLPDSTLDGLVSSITVEREQIGPNRYIADLGILFDRARAGEMLGVGGERRQSPPMLLIPITISAGTATSVELRNAWQRAWAQFRTSQSTIDYVRVSGMNVDPLLVNAAQTNRPGRGWWRNIVDLYGAADILVAEVQLQRLYPGGPARARFIGRHGPDNEIVGGFSLTAPNGEPIPAMMAEGVRRMVAISDAGISRPGDLRRLPLRMMGVLFRWLLRREVAEKRHELEILEHSALDWTVVRVGLLHDGPPRGAWRAADDGSIEGMGRIARADVAGFMLDQLDDTSWLRRKPALMD